MSSRFVLKKLLKMATVLALVTTAHLAYVRAFDHIVARLRADHGADRLAFTPQEPENKRRVKEVAVRAFGSDHWTSSDDQNLLRYMMPEKNLVLFAMNFKRPIEADGVKFEGKRIIVDPFAMTLGTPGDGPVRTLTSKTATIDLNKAFGINPKSDKEPLAIRKAVLEREVMIHDDRGTPDDPRDDLFIGPINEVQYIDDGVAPVIKSESEIVLVDRGLRVTGVGLEIQMRPKLTALPGKTGGFDGAQRVILKRDVRTTMLDVGSSGVTDGLGGGKGAVKTASKAGKDQQKDPNDAVPLDVRCQGPLVIDLPRNPSNPVVGPPQPPRPTFVEYRNVVVVRRGKVTEIPDQIDCDTLHLTLLPGDEKPKPAEAKEEKDAKVQVAVADESAAEQGSAEKKSAPGAFGGLALHRLKASGHAVWVQSPTQGVKIRCVELLHYKDPEAGKSTTIFNGGGPKKLWVEKRDIVAEGPDKGKVQSVTHIWCNDATLVDDGDMSRASLVANGPGLLESRPGLGADDAPREVPPSRTAIWSDQLWLQNESPTENREPGRILVLKGNPRVEDRDQKSSLEAAETIAVWLRPNEKKTETTVDGREVVPTAFFQTATNAAPAKPKESLPPIRKLVAVKDVHLVDPTRDMRLRDRLQVDFETGVVSTTPAVPSRNPNPLPRPAASTPAQTKAPAVAKPADSQAVPDLTPVPEKEKDKAAAPEKPAPPKVTAKAHSAEAVIVVSSAPAAPTETATTDGTAAKPEGSSTYELRELKMFDEVELHQDPAPGKTIGTNAVGEVLVLNSEAKGRLVFDLYHHNPNSDRGKQTPPSKAPKAHVQTDETDIVADTIGVDQEANQAWAYGAGTFKQLTDRGVLTDRTAEDLAKDKEQAEAADPKKARKRGGKAQNDKVTLTVKWQRMMTFEGISQDPQKRPAAKIKFYDGVLAQMEDGLLHGEKSMTIYTDKPIPLAEVGKLTAQPQAKDAADAEAAEPGPRADLSMLELVGTDSRPATAISRKVHPDRPVLLSQQRMEAKTLTYDRRSGMFQTPGPGQVFLYDRQAKGDQSANPDLGGAVAIRPTSYRPGEDDDVEPAPRPGAAAGVKERIVATPDARRAVGAVAKPLDPPLVLTQIKFQSLMRGRFGSGKEDDVDTQRWAEFFGAVETARGEIPEPVGPKLTQFDFDRLPAETTFLTSDALRVINEPPPVGAEKTANGRNFMKAWDNAYVNARDTALQADVITYDSLNDLVVANGLEGRPVRIVQQAAVGQSGAPLRAEVIKLNPKSGALGLGGPETVRLLDLKTGTRPPNMLPFDPDAKAPKKPKPPKRMQVNQMERKGFTGQ
ncbi:hypothetical protein [Paludisphaera rhizosphaerae]|uniref:hypothetical protein n=1 Tax=Paludisphaera rhizosphaerae TaxID=2711216 RepID=UPI0013EC836D|nr:hypothetical protein [Paludisphaera rhizosphaerae]